MITKRSQAQLKAIKYKTKSNKNITTTFCVSKIKRNESKGNTNRNQKERQENKIIIKRNQAKLIVIKFKSRYNVILDNRSTSIMT